MVARRRADRLARLQKKHEREERIENRALDDEIRVARLRIDEEWAPEECELFIFSSVCVFISV